MYSYLRVPFRLVQTWSLSEQQQYMKKQEIYTRSEASIYFGNGFFLSILFLPFPFSFLLFPSFSLPRKTVTQIHLGDLELTFSLPSGVWSTENVIKTHFWYIQSPEKCLLAVKLVLFSLNKIYKLKQISQLPNLCTGIRTIDLLAATH